MSKFPVKLNKSHNREFADLEERKKGIKFALASAIQIAIEEHIRLDHSYRELWKDLEKTYNFNSVKDSPLSIRGTDRGYVVVKDKPND